MDKEEAKYIIIDSISNLHKRRGELTLGDLESEVINLTCLEILKKRKENSSKAKSIEDIFGSVLNSTLDIVPYSKAFTEAAMELFPQYTEREAIAALIGIKENVMWEGMWDFLRDYFQKYHGISIDSTEFDSTIFYSTIHKRFENGNLVAKSEVERTITINIDEKSQEIIVSIAPSLSPKKGWLKSKNNSAAIYIGYDSDYKFTIQYDDYDEVEKFILEMPDRKLKIEYFE